MGFNKRYMMPGMSIKDLGRGFYCFIFQEEHYSWGMSFSFVDIQADRLKW